MSNELCYLSAVEATELFKNGELSPVELMEAIIARSERAEPSINAFSDTFFEQAVEMARASEARYTKGEPMGLLDGLPVAIKDEVDVRGQRNTEGSLIHEHRLADEDAVLAARLRAQGAIFHARTTCPEFCSLFNTRSRLFGVTRNPWNLEITPGGSSGGSGASLAAGTSTLASGSDIGGSIRFPASQCGIVGFKPPFGRVPESYSPFNLESYCANGPMARTVADTALMQNVMSGPYTADAASILPRVSLPLSYDEHLQGRKIAFNMDFGHFEVEADVARNTLQAIDRLKALGAEVEEVRIDWSDDVERAYYAHMDPLFFAQLTVYLEEKRDLMCDYNIVMAEQALERQRDMSAFYRATCMESDMYAEFGEMMKTYDAFICPTVTSNTLKADFNPAQDDYMINGEAQAFDLNLSTCHIFNMMGRCPAISVPSGLGDNGVPTGLHIVSSAYDDIAVFRVAAALEGTWDTPFRPEESDYISMM
jgi:Asp-tRNA(Asn)/Glu-tRNA(Gln) amidotransferase A subunit family amidase